MTTRLDVYLEGLDTPIGHLNGAADKSLGFAYSDDALRTNTQLSISLPASQQHFTDHKTRGFFANLLQENNSLEQVMAKHRIDRDDITSAAIVPVQYPASLRAKNRPKCPVILPVIMIGFQTQTLMTS